MQIACVASYSSWFRFSAAIYVCKGSIFQFKAPDSQSLTGMEKNRILEINIELPLTSLTLFSSLLKCIGSAAIWATCLINFNVIFSGWSYWKKTK